jgi:hypothetical protein
MENIKILFSGFIIGLILSYGVKGCNKENISLETKYDTIIDTLIVEKEVLKTKYVKSKESVVKYDSLYVTIIDTNCDNLVKAQRLALNDCDSLISKQDTLVKTLLIRDTLRIETIKNINKRKFKLRPFIGGGYNPINQTFNPIVGYGITF